MFGQASGLVNARDGLPGLGYLVGLRLVQCQRQCLTLMLHDENVDTYKRLFTLDRIWAYCSFRRIE
jgi:hypothetical protein